MIRNRGTKPVITAKSVFLAVVIHVIVVGLMFVSFRWYESDKPLAAQAQDEVMKAAVVNDEQIQKEIEKLKQEEQRKRNEERDRQRKLDEADRLAEEARKRREREEKNIAELKRKQEADKKRIEQEKKRAAELEKKRADEAEKKRVAVEAERQRVEQEKKRVEEEKLRLAEIEKQRQRELERRKEAESALREQLAAEEKQREAVRAAQAMSEVEKFKLLIQQKVERNWVQPANAQKGLSCVIAARLLVPGGDVMEARVVRSSGNPAFDRSVESAVIKASPLPLPNDRYALDQFRNEVTFKFAPKS